MFSEQLEQRLREIEALHPDFVQGVGFLRPLIERDPGPWERRLAEEPTRGRSLVCRYRGHRPTVYSPVVYRTLVTWMDERGRGALMTFLQPCQRCKVLLRTISVGFPWGWRFGRTGVILQILDNEPRRLRSRAPGSYRGLTPCSTADGV